MKRKTGLIWLCLALILLTLSACGKSGNSAQHASVDSLEPIKVELHVPAEVKAGESITFEAKVTHQGQDVNDAKEVMFEFWKEGDSAEDHRKEVVEGAGEGKYVLETGFDEPGTYHVISHVTARDQHSMPEVTFTVTE